MLRATYEVKCMIGFHWKLNASILRIIMILLLLFECCVHLEVLFLDNFILCHVHFFRWGQVFILDALSRYKAADAREAENIVERVTPRLQHANCAVVLSAVKVTCYYLWCMLHYFLIMDAFGSYILVKIQLFFTFLFSFSSNR